MERLSAFGGRISHVPENLFAICLGFFLLFGASLVFTNTAAAQNCGPYNISVAHGGSTQFTVTCDPFGLNSPSVTVQPSHGTITVLNINSGLVQYSHNGGADVATSDSFVLAGASAQSIQVNVTIGAASTMTISPGALGAMRAGVSFSQGFSASGGVAPYTFSLVSGNIPGLTLSGSTLSGTPTERGAHTLVIRATDNIGVTADKSYGVAIANPIMTTTPLNHNLAVGQASTASFTTTGGISPYSYTVNPGSGTLPPGITLASNGNLTGTPAAAGTYTFDVVARESSSSSDCNCPFFKLDTVTIVVANAPTIVVQPATVPGGGVGQTYSQTFTATGGTAPYTFSVSAGALPVGLTLSASDVLSGTPTAGGSFNFTIQATDANSFAGTRAYTLGVVAPTITISPATLPNLQVGTPYSQTISANGATAPYTFTISSGSLPSGISLSSSGILSGTPTTAGPFNFTVTATDSSTGTGPYSGARAYSVTVAPNVPVANAVSATVAFNSAGNPITLNITGGSPTSVAVGSAAAHGTATASGTSINYTPTSGYAGPDSFTYTATNGSGTSAPATVTITVGSPTLGMTPAAGALPNAAVGVAYSQSFTASGGTAPYVYTIAGGVLPAGLTLSGDVLSGTPTTAGPFSFSVLATDSSTGTGPFTLTQNYSLTVTPAAPVANPVSATVAFNSTSNPITLSLAGGAATSVAVASAATHGTAIASGTSISYTPTSGYAGTDSFTYTATNAGGTSAPATVLITIGSPTLGMTPAAGALPNATVGTAYNQTFAASGGTTPYSYAVTTGILPAGLSLSAGGTISGTPTTAGNVNFAVTATDSSTGTGAPFTVTRNYSLTIAPAALVLPATTLANGGIGTAYYAAINPATGGTAPYTYALTGGALPAGISVSSSDDLTGTPTAVGSFNFTLTATDSASVTASRNYAIAIGAPTLVLSPAAGTLTLPYGQAYSQTFTASGGTPAYNFAPTGGSLPVGMTFNSSGLLSGTPTQPGSYPLSIRATDSTTGTGAPFSLTQNYILLVPAPTISLLPETLPNGAIGITYAANVSASGGVAPYTFSLTSGALPVGISFSSAGQFSGTPLSAGTFTLTVNATDAHGQIGARTYTLIISAPTVTVSPTTLPAGTVAAAYSQSLTASGGSAPYTFAITAGSLPAGMILNGATGVLSGTPSAQVTANFTVTAIDSSGGTGPFAGSRAYSLIINAPTISLPATTLANGTVGTAYSATLNPATGGTNPYTYAVTAGALPTGLTLSAAGVISGIPAALVNATFTVTATDGSGAPGPYTASQTYALAIADAVPVANPVAATVAFGSGPNPIILNITGTATSVAIATAPSSGTATASGTSVTYQPAAGFAGAISFTYTATNASGTSAPATVSVTISPPTLGMAPAAGALPNATVGTAYSQTFIASGGTAPYTYAVTSGTLPAGLSLSTGGVVSGTPTAAGNGNFAITATDSSTGTGAPFAIAQNYSLTVGQSAPVANAVSATVAYNSAANPITLSIGGGPATSVAIASASAHGTATASGTSITYTPTAGYAGPDSFTYTATNAGGTSAPAIVSITISPPMLGMTPATGTLPNGIVGTAYNQTFVASGGTAPYTYAVTSGALPAGLSLSTGGVISGMPTTAGNVNFAVTATDNSTGAGAPFVIAQNYALIIGGSIPVANPVAATVAFGSGPNPITLDITGTATSVAIATAPSSGIATASGTAITYQPAAGFTGAVSFTYTASNASGTSAPALVTITVSPAPPVAQPQTIAVGYNQARAFTLTATGAGPLTFALVTAPSNGTVVVNANGSSTYTPNNNFSGTDSLVFGATGPGGTNNATITLNVAGPAVIAELSALSPSAGTLQPAFSPSVTSYTVEVPNTTENISLTPTSTAPNATITVQGQAVGSGSSSGPIQLPVGQTRITVVVTAQDNTTTKTYEVTVRRLPPAPMAASRTVEVLSGQTVHVDLTQGSTGGPFTTAHIVSISDSSAGPVSIDAFDMVYASATNFGGNLQVRYTLSNPYGTSSAATITFIVTARPDPSKDPEVTGLLTAQADSAKRFAANQIQNFNSRLEQLHDEGDRRNNSMAIRLGYSEENNPEEMDERFRDLLDQGSAPGISNGVPDFAMHSFAEQERKEQKQSQPAPDVNLGRLAVWSGGFVNFGDRNDGDMDFDYTTVGVSAGMDYRFSKKFVAGFGFGYGRDASDIGENGTESRAHAYSAAIYGSYSPVKSVFIDGLIGGSWLDFSSNRYVTSTGDFASGDRDGQQIFGSLTASYEHRTDAWLISPYGRFDFSRSWLNGFTESSGGAFALKYGDQTVDTLSGIVGLRLEYTIPMEWGALKPGMRAEYTHDFEGSSLIKLGYADTSGLPYDYSTENSGSDYVTLGASLDAQLDTDWTANFDYRTTVGADNQNHAFGLRVGKKF